jgi:hypothetical protein
VQVQNAPAFHIASEESDAPHAGSKQIADFGRWGGSYGSVEPLEGIGC